MGLLKFSIGKFLLTSFSIHSTISHRVVKEIESSIVQHYRDFCFENRIELSKFRRVYFRKKDAEDRDPRLCQALSQITADPSVDSKALLIINKLNAQGDLIDLLLIPKGSPYYDFCEDVQDFPPIREGDMFVMTVSRRDKSRPGFKYIAVVQDEVPPDIKLKRAASIAVREVSVIFGCNPRVLMAEAKEVTRVEFVKAIRDLDKKGIRVLSSITERFPELEISKSIHVAA